MLFAQLSPHQVGVALDTSWRYISLPGRLLQMFRQIGEASVQMVPRSDTC